MLHKIHAGFLKFAEDIEGFSLRPFQKEAISRIITSLITGSGDTLTNLWARKAGKSETIKALILSVMSLMPHLARIPEVIKVFPHVTSFKDGISIAIAGPKMGTASLSFKRIRRQAKSKSFQALLGALGLEITTSNSVEFELSNGSIAQAFSGSETASSEGPDAHLLYLDEAQLLSPYSVYKILRPITAASDGPVVETGTPGRKRCPFLEDIEFNLRKHRDAHLAVPYDQVVPYSPNYGNYIKAQIERLPGGRENIYFRMNFLLEWILSTGHFIDASKFLTLASPQRAMPGPWDYIYGGIDWGKADSSTFVVIEASRRDHYQILDILRPVNASYDAQFKEIVPFLKKWFDRGMLKVSAETNSAGDPNTERLQRIFGKARIEGHYTTPARKDKIFTLLQGDIDAGRWHYFQDHSPEALEYEREFLDAEQEVRGNLLSVHKPDGENAADDALDATGQAHSLFPRRDTGQIPLAGVSSGHRRRSIDKTKDF